MMGNLEEAGRTAWWEEDISLHARLHCFCWGYL